MAIGLAPTAAGFEGRITAALTRGHESRNLLYTVSANVVQIERTETDRPHPRNIIDLKSGETTLVFPHNGSFVRLKSQTRPPTPGLAGNVLSAGALPPGIGPQPGSIPTQATGATIGVGPGGLSAFSIPGIPSMPALPTMPADVGPGSNPAGLPMPAPPAFGIPGEPLQLKATGEKKELLGRACSRYEIKRHDEVMEIWATEELMPFQSYLSNQPSRFGPRSIDDQWAGLLKEKSLFPLLAVLKSDTGTERMRFEVKAVVPEKIEDPDAALSRPPKDYQEIQPSLF